MFVRLKKGKNIQLSEKNKTIEVPDNNISKILKSRS